MAEQQPPTPARATPDVDTGPKTAPQTDPTNPYHQESAGLWTRQEEASVRKEDEPGLTDRDRVARRPTF